jgi:hypothetical protein
MKQLIFRLNQQQFRNNRYKKKEQPSDNSMSYRGASIDDPIEVDDASMDEKPLTASAIQQQADHNPTSEQSHIVKLPISGQKMAKFGLGASDTSGSRQDVANRPSRRTGATLQGLVTAQRRDVEYTTDDEVPTSPKPSGPPVSTFLFPACRCMETSGLREVVEKKTPSPSAIW